MGRGNKLAGSDRTKRPSFSCDEDLLDAFDNWVEDETEFTSRSDALKRLMKDAVTGGVSHDTPRVPPAEEPLHTGYKQLVRAANADGWVTIRTARVILSSNGLGIPKDEVRSQILKPLNKRGYIRRSSNVYGDTSYRIRPGRDD